MSYFSEHAKLSRRIINMIIHNTRKLAIVIPERILAILNINIKYTTLWSETILTVASIR